MNLHFELVYGAKIEHVWTYASTQQCHWSTHAYWIDHKSIYLVLKLFDYVAKYTLNFLLRWKSSLKGSPYTCLDLFVIIVKEKNHYDDSQSNMVIM